MTGPVKFRGSGLRYEIPIGLQHVEYDTYKFFANMAKRDIEMLAFPTLFEQVVVERPVPHGYQPSGLQYSPAQISLSSFDHGCLAGVEFAGLESRRFHTGEGEQLSRCTKPLD